MEPNDVENLQNSLDEITTHINQASTILSEEVSMYQFKNGQEFVEDEESLASDILEELMTARDLLNDAITELENLTN